MLSNIASTANVALISRTSQLSFSGPPPWLTMEDSRSDRLFPLAEPPNHSGALLPDNRAKRTAIVHKVAGIPRSVRDSSSQSPKRARAARRSHVGSIGLSVQACFCRRGPTFHKETGCTYDSTNPPDHKRGRPLASSHRTAKLEQNTGLNKRAHSRLGRSLQPTRLCFQMAGVLGSCDRASSMYRCQVLLNAPPSLKRRIRSRHSVLRVHIGGESPVRLFRTTRSSSSYGRHSGVRPPVFRSRGWQNIGQSTTKLLPRGLCRVAVHLFSMTR